MSDGLALRGQLFRGAQAVGLARTVPQRPALAAFLRIVAPRAARELMGAAPRGGKGLPNLPRSLHSLVQAG